MTQTMIRRPSPGEVSAPEGRRRPTWLAVALFMLGVGAALVAVLGPLVTGVISYHASDGAVNQIVGGDIAGLLLVAPVSVLAGVLVWRGHPAGPFLALAPAGYALYMYAQLAVSLDVGRYPATRSASWPSTSCCSSSPGPLRCAPGR